MDDINTKIIHLQSELIEIKNNHDYMLNKLDASRKMNSDLKSKIHVLDCEILCKQNELNNRLNNSQQTKKINSYSQYIQDVTKRWTGRLNEVLHDYSNHFDNLLPGKGELIKLAQEFLEVKNQILTKDLKPGWSRDTVKRYAENLMSSIENDARNDLSSERDELIILQRRIESEAELLKFSVTDKQLEPPVFPVNLLENLNLTELGRKDNRHSVKFVDETPKRAKKVEHANLEFQQPGPSSNGPMVNPHRYQQQQYPAQPQNKLQEVAPINTSQTFGTNEKPEEHIKKATAHRVNIGESQERNEDPPSNPVRNHVKFEEFPRSNQYGAGQSFDESISEQSEMETRKRKKVNELQSSMDKVIDLREDSPEYVDADDNMEAKRAKFDTEKEPVFGDNFYEPDFLRYPSNTQELDEHASDSLFTFTQEFSDLDDFFGSKHDPGEKEKSVKGALH